MSTWHLNFLIGYKIKETSERVVCLINPSSWPNMSTGDPVVSSECAWLTEPLNETLSGRRNPYIQAKTPNSGPPPNPTGLTPHFSTTQCQRVCLHHWPVDTHDKQQQHQQQAVQQCHAWISTTKHWGKKTRIQFDFLIWNHNKQNGSEVKQQSCRFDSQPAERLTVCWVGFTLPSPHTSGFPNHLLSVTWKNGMADRWAWTWINTVSLHLRSFNSPV